MKKIILSLFVAALACTNIRAQLVVDSLGKVMINLPESSSDIYSSSAGYSATICPSLNGGILIQRPNNDSNGSFCGINIDINGNGPSAVGVLAHAKEGVLYSYGVKGTATAQSGHFSIPGFGVFGGLSSSTSSSAKGAGVYGTTAANPPLRTRLTSCTPDSSQGMSA